MKSNSTAGVKSNLINVQILFLAVFITLISGLNAVKAQTYTYEIKGDSVADCNTFYFTVWVSASGGNISTFDFGQFSVWISKAFINGTVATGNNKGITFVPGSSDIGITTQTVALLSSATTEPGSGADTSIIRINNTAIPCGVVTLTSTPVRYGQFKVVRTGAGCWGCVPNKLGFFTGTFSGGNKTTPQVAYYDAGCANHTVTAVNGTFINSHLNNQTPVITSQPIADTICANAGIAQFSLTAISVNPGSTGTITYQWLENGILLSNTVPYSGVTTPTLTLTNPPFSLNGNNYSCIVTQCSSVSSSSGILTVNSCCIATPSTINQTACNNYAWNGSTYTESTSVTDHIITLAGCDSAATLNLTINYSSVSSTSASVCNSYTWNGVTYSASTSVTDHFTNAAGCDSAATLNLTINYSSISSNNVTACNSYTWNSVTYTLSTNVTKHFTNAGGCDSAATLNLTVNYSSTSTSNITACNNYTWNGVTYIASTSVTNHFTNASGCDSAATLNLTINLPPSAASASAGSSYVCSGSSVNLFSSVSGSPPFIYSWFVSGGYNGNPNFSTAQNPTSPILTYDFGYNGIPEDPTFTVFIGNSCGGIVAQTNVLLFSPISSTSNVTSCDSYVWNGTTYTSSGTYSYDAGNAVLSGGCDSVAFLNLTINSSSSSTTNATTCNSYVWNGTTYTASGHYVYHTNNVAGCDSAATLNLTTGACTITFSIKMFIQGYYLGGGLMQQCLYYSGIDPDPNSTKVDTVTISLVDPVLLAADPLDNATLADTVATAKGILQTNGSLSVSFPISVSGNRDYIMVTHRNALETWSKNSVTITNGGFYDFTNAINKAYRDNMVSLGDGNYAFWSGDVFDEGNGINYAQDGVIDGGDYALEQTDFTQFLFGYYSSDITGDGVVDGFDYALLQTNFKLFIFKQTP